MTDTLVLSFQTQLSAVMETVLKTTMYEITRLVEESFLEQMDRGKREAEVLRRRLIVSEAKLRERERFKRVRCVDCGRTAVPKRRILNRGTDTQCGLGQPLILKQEKASDRSWRCSAKGSTMSNQEKPSTVLETQQNAVLEDGPKDVGEVKEEATVARDNQACLLMHSQVHKQKDSHNQLEETIGLDDTDSDHRTLKNKPSGGTPCTEKPGNEDDVLHRNQPKWFSSKTDPLPQPEPVRTSSSTQSQGLRPQVGSLDSGSIKQEVVVMLPTDWEDIDRIRPPMVSAHSSAKKTQLELKPGDPVTARPQVEERVPYPVPPINVQGLAPQTIQHSVRKNTKVVLYTNAVVSDKGANDVNMVHSICKGLPAPKPSQLHQYTEGAGTGERSFSTVHQGRGLPQVINMRVQGDTRHNSARTTHDCNQCGKGFSHLCHLRAHQQIHTGERQFCCTICSKSFTKLSNLKAHRRVHTGERPYICTDCGKRFTQKCNLKRHQRIHSEFTHSNI
ncbi:zinc finger and SCAN domain-containing protein 10-like [Xyrauchen texanus]|uniref:zinc finger and SCAN domain-containing protein 10-like n=1 Tax=Xyrauchen texanus TaxID=154827 RepID=UPI002241E2B9|nr:zinc finger and SCAN domain-containing protein 10-like [Xyrauchen texanus]